jgi:hypothetical protein
MESGGQTTRAGRTARPSAFVRHVFGDVGVQKGRYSEEGELEMKKPSPAEVIAAFREYDSTEYRARAWCQRARSRRCLTR